MATNGHQQITRQGPGKRESRDDYCSQGHAEPGRGHAGWLIVTCGVCQAIPLARLSALLFTAGLCLIQPAKVRRPASAWKGRQVAPRLR